jgi:hypothetical protein
MVVPESSGPDLIDLPFQNRKIKKIKMKITNGKMKKKKKISKPKFIIT